MQLFGFNHSKCKTQCRLGVGRIKLLRNKKQIAMKNLRKEVAELLRQGKQGNARIRVEAVMREFRMLQAFEILELYLELLAVRSELLAKTREIPPDMVEAISSLIYAGERVATDLAEIAQVAKMLISKYSPVYKASGFPEEVVSDLTCFKWQVNHALKDCLAISAPLPEEKLKFLEEIAGEYGVDFDKDAAALDMLPAAGKPLAVAPTYAVEPLAPGGGGVPRPPPLAQGWMPPPSAATPPPAEQQQGWQPPGAGTASAGTAAGAGAAAAAASHVSRVLSGNSVVVRQSAGNAPGTTATPSASEAPGWSPPQPEDMNKHGRAFQNHVGAAAAWRQVRLHGASPSSTPDPSVSMDSEGYPPPATSAPKEVAQPPAAGAALPYSDLPPGSTVHSSGDSTPTVGDKPFTPGSSYADATAAAEAARRYSQMAQQAAQRAEEFAASQAAATRGKGGSLGGDDGEDSGSGSTSGGNSGSGGGGARVLVPRTLSEVQRAYDAAPGPPSKGDFLAGGPPSAPPSEPAPPAPPMPGGDSATNGDSSAVDLDISGLPSVPGARGAASADQDELDELTKRFEMLKRR